MKKILLTLVLFVPALLAISQTPSPRPVDPFQKIDAAGDVHVILVSSSSYAIDFNGSEEAPEGLEWSISSGTLTITAKKVKETATVKVSAPSLDELKLSSVASASTEDVFNTQTLKLVGDGASDFNMKIETQNLTLNFQGATNAKLSGNAENLTAHLSGASDVKAYDLTTKNADIKSDGASDIKFTVTDNLKAFGSGASDITYKGDPTEVQVDAEGAASIRRSDAPVTDSDTPSISIEDDHHDCYDNDDENTHNNNGEYDGHWAGLDLMMNTFMSNYGDMEFNYNIIKEKLGVTTGLGLSVMNYRLGDEVRLTGDSAAIFSNSDLVSNTIRSKLTVSYLTLPLMFELQSNSGSNNKSFHFGIGVFGGVKVGSHSKVVTDDGGKDKYKSQDDFHLNPFRYGAMVRLGWNSVNLFAQYSLSEMFQSGEGPVVYPMEFGFSFDLN